MIEMPMVSVLMAAYNRADLLGSAIESFFRQSYTNMELVICDDCSTDTTEAVIIEYVSKDSRIRYLKNEKNIGFIHTMNRLFTSARGEFVCILDSDDYMSDDRISYQVNRLMELKADGIINEFIKVDIDGSLHPHEPRYNHPKRVLPHGNDIMFPSGSIMMRKKVLELIKGYHPYFSDSFCGDIYFINAVAEKFVVYYDPTHVYYYRLTPGSMTQLFSLYKLSKLAVVKELINQRSRTGTDLLEQQKMDELEELRIKLINNKKWRSEQYRIYAARCIDQNEKSNGANLLQKAFLLNPFSKKNYRTLAYLLKK